MSPTIQVAAIVLAIIAAVTLIVNIQRVERKQGIHWLVPFIFVVEGVAALAIGLMTIAENGQPAEILVMAAEFLIFFLIATTLIYDFVKEQTKG